MRAEEMFKEYATMKKELSVLQFQMEHFKGVSESDIMHSMQFSHPDGDRVQTSTLSDKTATVALNYRAVMERENNEWFSFLWNRYRYINEEVEFFERCLVGLPDILPDLMMDLLSKELTWEEMTDKYHICGSTITKYKKKAISLLDEMYELRDRQTECYILG